MRDLDFPMFSLSCLKLYGFLWTPFHTPLPQPHCSRWISNNRTPLCLLPCSHVHSQRDIRDAGNRRQWRSSSSPAFNYWLLSLLHKLQVLLNSLMRISRAGRGGGEGREVVCITAITSDAIWTVQTYLVLQVFFFFFFVHEMGRTVC